MGGDMEDTEIVVAMAEVMEVVEDTEAVMTTGVVEVVTMTEVATVEEDGTHMAEEGTHTEVGEEVVGDIMAPVTVLP